MAKVIMGDGTELTHDSTKALGDEGSGNGPASSTIRDDVPREPSLALTDERSTALPSPSLSAAVLQELEERVRSLEEKYAALKDTGIIEDRVVQRLTSRLRKKPVTEIRPSG